MPKNINEHRLAVWQIDAFASIDLTDEEGEALFPPLEEAIEAGFEAMKNRLAETAPQVRLELRD